VLYLDVLHQRGNNYLEQSSRDGPMARVALAAKKFGQTAILWTCTCLATPFAHRVTGGTVYVAGGDHILAWSQQNCLIQPKRARSVRALMSSIAVINAGSSSIKFAVFQSASTPSLLLRGQIEGIGTTPRAKLSDPRGKLLVEESFEDKGFDHAA